MDYAFIDRFYTISERMRRIMIQRKQVQNITRQEFSMLLDIRRLEQEGEKVNTARLSDVLSVSKSAVSQTINALEEKELLTRKPDPLDRRQPSIHLTDRGNSLLKLEETRVYSSFIPVFEHLGKENSVLFLQLLEKFAALCEEFPGTDDKNT